MARVQNPTIVIEDFPEAKGLTFGSKRKALNFIMTRLSGKDLFIHDEMSGEFEITRNGKTCKGKIVIGE